MASHFLVLEMLDPRVNAVLGGIREILSEKPYDKPVHLTIRGPYEKPIPRSTLKRCEALLSHDVIAIQGIGRFRNAGEEVVFFGAESPNLRELWWKRDFSIKHHGFAPHVSVYRGPDAALADAAASFLKEQKVTLLCAEFRVVSRRRHLAVQEQLFRRYRSTAKEREALLGPGGLLAQLREFVREHRAGAGCGPQSLRRAMQG